MTIWAPQNLGDNISEMALADDAQDEAIRSCERGSTEPTLATRPNGCLWLCTNSTILTGLGFGSVAEMLLRWDGSNWKPIADVAAPALNAAGTVVPTADLSLGSHKITSLAAGSASTDAARVGQVVLLDGSAAMAANLDLASHEVKNVAAPTTGGSATNKTYVDAAVLAVQPAGGSVALTGSLSALTASVELGFDPAEIVVSVSASSGHHLPTSGGVVPDGAVDAPVTISVVNFDSSDTTRMYLGTITVTRRASISGGGPGFEFSYSPGNGGGTGPSTHTLTYFARRA